MSNEWLETTVAMDKSRDPGQFSIERLKSPKITLETTQAWSLASTNSLHQPRNVAGVPQGMFAPPCKSGSLHKDAHARSRPVKADLLWLRATSIGGWGG